MSTSDVTHSQSPQASQNRDGLRGHACILCQQRKVKCDRRDPCSACTRSRVDCVFRATNGPRRQRKKAPEASLIARLKKYERLLTSYGANLDNFDAETRHVASDNHYSKIAPSDGACLPGLHRKSSHVNDRMDRSRSTAPDNGKLIVEQGKSRYLENNLWTGLSDEFRDPKDMLQASSSDDESNDIPNNTPSESKYNNGGDLLFASNPTGTNLRSLHPRPVSIFRLWQTFLDNINPITKIIHSPTVQYQILEASGNLDKVPKSVNALMFVIYFFAVVSMDHTECENTFGETRTTLLTRYQSGAQQALISAGYLKSSDLVVLQAFVLFLLSMRQFYDPHSLWALTGIAVRIGQRIGLHRDGASLKLPPFDTELRRRLWWQIIMLDARAGELSGSGSSIVLNLWDTRPPLNVNDSDLYPDMRDPPIEHPGPTEMIFSNVRNEVGQFLKHSNSGSTTGFGGGWQAIDSAATPLAIKDQAIEELEKRLEQKVLRHCDPLIPLHLLTIYLTKAVTYKIRLRSHHPRQYPDRGASMPQSEKDMLFSTSVQILENDNLHHSTKSMQRFRWHSYVHFQWDALIYALSELRIRTLGDEVDGAWGQVNEIFEHHPEMITDKKNAIHIATANLTAKAWKAHEADYSRQHRGSPPLDSPRFIRMMCSQSKGPKAAEIVAIDAKSSLPIQSFGNMAGGSQVNKPLENDEYPVSNLGSSLDSPFSSELGRIDSSAMDWAEWDNLIQDFVQHPVDIDGHLLLDQS